MRIKIILSSLSLMLLCACIGVQQDKLGHGKPDFHKAALLNVEMGEEYLAQGQIARAKQKFIHALELQPKLPEAYSSFGFFYETVGDNTEAENHYKQAIAHANGDGKFHNNYGTFLCRQKRYDEADIAFNRALHDKKYLNTAEVYENAGLCALQKSDLVKAREYLSTALKRDPYRAKAHLELAQLELTAHNYATARSHLESFNSRQNPSAQSLWLSTQLHKIFADAEGAAKDASNLKAMFPDSPEYQAYLATQNHATR